MKAIVYRGTGDPSVLQLVDREVRDPGPREVRIRIMISGVKPTDWKPRRKSAPGEPLTFAEVGPNQDGSGVVAPVGAGVEQLHIGDRVWLSERPLASRCRFDLTHTPDAPAAVEGDIVGKVLIDVTPG